MLLLQRRTGFVLRQPAHTSRYRSGLNSRAARDVMMKVCDGDLHAERQKRQPKQPKSKS